MLESLKNILERFFSSLKISDKIKGDFVFKKKLHHIMVVMAFTYLGANLVSNLIIPMLNRLHLKTSTPNITIRSEKVSDFNYRDLKKSILDRNIFNETGEFPVETEALVEKKTAFNLEGPCVASKLPYQLLGTLYDSESGNSLASIKDKNYNSADTYSVGDLIFGTEDTVIAAILPNTVILNNSNNKECLYSSDDAVQKGESGELSIAAGKDELSNTTSNSSVVALESAWVEFELGPGFSKILQTGNITPNIVSGRVSGYIVTNPYQGSLFDKVGLKSMDVITQVNEITLNDKNDGFTLYSAFQNESFITIHIQRGAVKKRIEVEIK